MEDLHISLSSSNSVDSAYESETKQQHHFPVIQASEMTNGVTPSRSMSMTVTQKGSRSTVMGTFLKKRGSVASTASMFEKASLAEAQQHLGARTSQSLTRQSLNSNSLSASRSFASPKLPGTSKNSDMFVAGDVDDVFSCPTVCSKYKAPPVSSVTTNTLNNSYSAVSWEKGHSLVEEKASAECTTVSEELSMEKPENSTSGDVATKSGPIWSAPQKKYQVKMFVNNQPAPGATTTLLPVSQAISSTSHPTNQPPINTGTTMNSSNKSRTWRRQHLSYDGPAGLGLSSDSSRPTCADRRTLKKSHTMDTDVLSVQAPRVTVCIHSKQVDNCQLDIFTNYRQKPAVVQVTGDSQYD